MPLFVAHGTKGNSTGDISSAVLILRTTVQEEQSFRFQGLVCGRSSLIVHDGAVLLIAGDRVKANIPEERLLPT